MSNVMTELGWDSELQNKIRHVCRNTRESVKHTIVGMRSKSFTGELFISVIDRSAMVPVVIAQSVSLPDRDTQIEMYDRLIRSLDLPFCCVVHKTEVYGDGPSFLDDLDEDDEDGFDFDEEADPNGFDFDDEAGPDDFDFDAEDADDDDFDF